MCYKIKVGTLTVKAAHMKTALTKAKSGKGLAGKPVMLSNALNRSVQTFTLVEKRLLMAAVAKMAGFSRPITITAAEYVETYGTDESNPYGQLKQAAKQLFQRYLVYEELHVREESKKVGIMSCYLHWVRKAKYCKDAGCVTLEFDHEIIPHLCELSNKFTQYQLKQAAALRSVYSWRLLELLEQMRTKEGGKKTANGWLSIGLEEFLDAVGAGATHRKNFAWLRKKIIEPAIKELTEKDNWLIEWQVIKTGRKVTALRFDFKRNPQERLPL